MSFRLYESAWVHVEGLDHPVRVFKDRQLAGSFIVEGHRYDIDARALSSDHSAPRLTGLLSMQDVREVGLRCDYGSE